MKRMYRSMEIKGAVAERKHDDGRTIYRAVATSDALDRYGDIVLSAGADLRNYTGKNANPVLLGIHDYNEVTIGHVLSMEIRERDIVAEFVFAKDDIGQKYETRYQDGDMRAFSIGFRAMSGGVIQLWTWWDDEPDIKEITIEMPDGSEKTISFKGMEQVPYRIFKQWEMMELSAVPVPANPEALLMKQAEGIIRKAITANPNMKSFAQQRVREIMEPLLKHLRSLEDAEESDAADGHVAQHLTVNSTYEPFKHSEAKTNLVKWASKDGTGEKDTINWAKLASGFASYDAHTLDNFGSYKFLHHDIVKDEKGEDRFALSWEGLKTAMAALLGEVEGESISDDVKAAYDHLASHYVFLEKVAPELREHEDAEIEEIESEAYVAQKSEPASQPAASAEGADGDNPDAKSGSAKEKGEEDSCSCSEKMLKELTKMFTKRLEELDEMVMSLNIKATAIQDLLELRAPVKKVVGGNGVAEAVLEIDASLMDRLGNLAE